MRQTHINTHIYHVHNKNNCVCVFERAKSGLRRRLAPVAKTTPHDDVVAAASSYYFMQKGLCITLTQSVTKLVPPPPPYKHVEQNVMCRIRRMCSDDDDDDCKAERIEWKLLCAEVASKYKPRFGVENNIHIYIRDIYIYTCIYMRRRPFRLNGQRVGSRQNQYGRRIRLGGRRTIAAKYALYAFCGKQNHKDNPPIYGQT